MSDQWVGPLGAGSNPAPSLTYGTFEQPFSEGSVWNTPLNSDASYQSTGTHPYQESQNYYGAGMNNTPSYGHPFYEAAGGDDTYTFDFADLRVNDGSQLTGAAAEGTLKVPAAAAADNGTDGHLHILDGTDLYDVYQASVDHTAKTLTTSVWAHKGQIDGDGLGVGSGVTNPNGGTRAYGGASIAGMVRKWEMDAGVIRHRLAMMLPSDALREDDVSYQWPATRKDGFSYSNPSWGAHMGEGFRIPPSVDVTSLGLGSTAVIIAKALQDYGGHIVDQSAATSVGMFDLECSGVYSISGTEGAIIADELRRLTDVTAINPGG